MEKFELIYKGQFKKDLKKYLKKKDLLEEIAQALDILENYGVEGISETMLPHKLRGNYKNHWECHIRPDTLLILFQYNKPTKQIHLVRLGSHSELFK